MGEATDRAWPGEVFMGTGRGPYLERCFPVAEDFFHPAFAEFLGRLNHPFMIHRKLWEWAFIAHRIERAGALRPGARGLCFGAGTEPLPALFAARGCAVVATDAPPEVGEVWTGTREHSRSLDDLARPEIIDPETFRRLVTHEVCDMNAIPSRLRSFDFCWSACSLEHLGDLRHGMDFVLASMETLRPGGVAAHTTELNLSSNTETIAEGHTVLYRRRDLEALAEELRAIGCRVEPLIFAPGPTPVDLHVDMPPYSGDPHLKIRLMDYVTTSVGIVATRGD
ncbi:class I SAM-dependent methyltransferase [Rubrimonas sp.]|uniref:class I SAM-dependent methyltransferase n=1 Tax=Rubrimonas sp. TaxID=2036015 RepID=UPI002FDD30C2